MSRPLRLEFEGVLYHVTSRGDRRESIVEDGYDRGLAVVRPRVSDRRPPTPHRPAD
jgi:hypothetical protein